MAAMADIPKRYKTPSFDDKNPMPEFKIFFRQFSGCSKLEYYGSMASFEQNITLASLIKKSKCRHGSSQSKLTTLLLIIPCQHYSQKACCLVRLNRWQPQLSRKTPWLHKTGMPSKSSTCAAVPMPHILNDSAWGMGLHLPFSCQWWDTCETIFGSIWRYHESCNPSPGMDPRLHLPLCH